jgi:hypothetical protein
MFRFKNSVSNLLEDECVVFSLHFATQFASSLPSWKVTYQGHCCLCALAG